MLKFNFIDDGMKECVTQIESQINTKFEKNNINNENTWNFWKHKVFVSKVLIHHWVTTAQLKTEQWKRSKKMKKDYHHKSAMK